MIVFTIKETTRGSKNKEYKYIGQQKMLDTPTEYNINNKDGTTKQIINRYKNEVRKWKEPSV